MKYLVIHHTAVSRKDLLSQLISVNKYHQQKWNMLSGLGWYVGYNYFIDTNGSKTYCRAIGEETVAVKGHNFDSIHICLAGNFNKELPLGVQVETLRKLLTDIESRFKDLTIKFHSAFSDTNCPGVLFTKEYLETVVLKTVILKNDIKTSDHEIEKEKQIIEISKKLSLLERLLFELRKLLKRFPRGAVKHNK